MHETSAWAWCTGKTQRNRVEREVGRGIRMGNTCKSMVDSCQCMGTLFLTKEARLYNAAKTASSINGTGKSEQLLVKE